MARLPFNPKLFPTPDFSTDTFRDQRTALANDDTHPGITTEELAVVKLKCDRPRYLDTVGAQWEAQIEEDRRAAFKFHPRAIAKLERREFEHLWMFGAAASEEALSIEMAYTGSGRVTFKTHEDVTPGSLCIPNCDLTWVEIVLLKTCFLECMRSLPLVWSTQNIDMFERFFIGLEMHPLTQKPSGTKALARYFTLQYMTFFKQLKNGQVPGNLAIINKEVLAECVDWAREQEEERRKKEDAQRDAREERRGRQMNEMLRQCQHPAYDRMSAAPVPSRRPRAAPYPDTAARSLQRTASGSGGYHPHRGRRRNGSLSRSSYKFD